MLLSLCAAALAGVSLSLLRPVGAATSGWKPISADDLNITAAGIGYPNADAAIVFREGELDDDSAEGTVMRVYVRLKVFTERGRRYADVQLPYRMDLGKITDVHARTIGPDGKAIEVEKRDIFDKLLLTSGRNVWRAKTFSMPNVEPGSMIEYRYRQVYPSGFGYFALDLQADLFIRDLEYRVRPEHSSSMEVRWVAFNSKSPDDFAPKWNGSYRIKAQNIPPFRREPLMPPEQAVKVWGWLYYSKGTEIDADKYWREYGQRMYDQSMAETRPTAAIRGVVASIVQPADPIELKVARAYNYVQREIRPVDAEIASADHLKHNSDADQTLRRRYGTPSDINSLFAAMLRAAGLDARVAELTTRDENLFHHSFPDAFQFNSEVTAIAQPDGTFRFFDPGSRYCPIGLLAWPKEGVPALVYDKDNPPFVVTVITPADRSREDRTMTVTPLLDGRVKLLAKIELTGQRAMDLRNETTQSAAEGAQAPIMDELTGGLSGAVFSSPVKFAGIADENQPVAISYECTIPAFSPSGERRLLLRPALLGRQNEMLFTAETRINKIYFHYPYSETDRLRIEIPEGYAAEQLPDDVNIDIGAMSYRAKYSRDGNAIIYERTLSVNGITFDVDQYQTVKSFFERVHQADQAVVSLKR